MAFFGCGGSACGRCECRVVGFELCDVSCKGFEVLVCDGEEDSEF